MTGNSNFQKKSIDEEEIDLRLLFLSIADLVARNTWVLVSALIVGIGLGLLQYFISPPVYESSMIASSRLLTYIRVESMIGLLDKLAQERSDTLLAKELNVEAPIAAQLVQIQAKSIKSKSTNTEVKVNESTASQDDNVFEIAVHTYNNQVVDSLQAGILYYLQHNAFVAKRTAIQKKKLETMQARVKEEVNKLDSLRFSVNQLLIKGIGSNSTMMMNDPASVNKDLMSLYERELDIQSALQLIDDIQVIQNFIPFAKPVGPKIIKDLIVGLSFSFTLAFIFIVIREVKRGVKKLRREVEQPLKETVI